MSDQTLGVQAPAERGDPLARSIGWLLRTGTVVSVGLMLAGAALSYHRHPALFAASAEAAGRGWSFAYAPDSLGIVLQDLGTGRGRALILLGLLVLIATPLARVALSFVSFLRSGDRVFAGLTLLVLVLLALSFQVGRRASHLHPPASAPPPVEEAARLPGDD